MMGQTASIYVLSIVLPVLVISATRNEHPLTLLHEIYTYVKNVARSSWGLVIRIVQKAPIQPYMDALLTRLGRPPQPPNNQNHNVNIEPAAIDPEELSDASFTVRDEYADLISTTIGLLRQGEDLSLAYRELTYIPTFFASTPEGFHPQLFHTWLPLTTFSYPLTQPSHFLQPNNTTYPLITTPATRYLHSYSHEHQAIRLD